MGYVLYGDKGSGSAAIELALAELGQPYELRTTSLDNHEQRGTGYGAVNAQQKLPTLITPEGETLTESAAILVTLADRHAGLLPPRTEADGALVLRWLTFVACELYPLIEIIDYPERFLPARAAGEHREPMRAHVRQIWKQRFKILEAAVAGTPWFLASGFTALDLYIAVVSRWAQVGEWRKAELPRIEALAHAVAERPACRAVWDWHFAD